MELAAVYFAIWASDVLAVEIVFRTVLGGWAGCVVCGTGVLFCCVSYVMFTCRVPCGMGLRVFGV